MGSARSGGADSELPLYEGVVLRGPNDQKVTLVRNQLFQLKSKTSNFYLFLGAGPDDTKSQVSVASQCCLPVVACTSLAVQLSLQPTLIFFTVKDGPALRVFALLPQPVRSSSAAQRVI